MPLVNLPPSPPKEPDGPKNPKPVILPDNYRHSVVDAKATPLAALLTHIEGSTWVVDYYGQILGADEQPTEFSPNQLAPYQQYQLIKNYELKLQGSLSVSEDPATHEMTVTGTALVFPYMTPIFGDVFIADIGDGLAGQFSIGQPGKKTLLKETTYEFSFTLARYADAALIEALNNRVVKTGYYQRDYLVYGSNPVVTSAAVDARTKLQEIEQTLLQRWMTDFYSSEYKTFLLPKQDTPTYDPWVTRAIFRLYDRNDHPGLRKARELNCQGIPAMQHTDFWNAVVTLDKNALYGVFTQAQRIPTDSQRGFPYMDGVRYSGVQYIIGPGTNPPNVDTDYAYGEDAWFGAITISEITGGYDPAAANTAFNAALAAYTAEYETDAPVDVAYQSTTIPLLRPIASDSRYVLTQAFFDGNVAGMTKIERLLMQYFNEEKANRVVIYALFDSWKHWGRLERFYYTPLLLAMIRVTSRTLQ